MLTFKSMEKIAIASGKGGVGKTSLTLIIANFLKSKGYKVGLLDAETMSSTSLPSIASPPEAVMRVLSAH